MQYLGCITLLITRNTIIAQSVQLYILLQLIQRHFLFFCSCGFLRHQRDYQVGYNHAVIKYSTFFHKSLILIFIFLKGSVISFEKNTFGNKTKIIFLVNRVFGQNFTRNAKICCFVSKDNFCNFLSPNLCGFDPWSR